MNWTYGINWSTAGSYPNVLTGVNKTPESLETNTPESSEVTTRSQVLKRSFKKKEKEYTE
jgi:hypothetical protein